MGMPLQVVVGEKNLKNNLLELKDRLSGKRWTAESGNLLQEVVGALRSAAV